MTLFYALYLALTSLLFLCLFPYFLLYMGITRRYASRFSERFGFIPHVRRQARSSGPRIWIHAVSLGEVRVAGSLIHILKNRMPDCSVIVSTTTAHGRNMALEHLGEDVPVIYAPIDLIWCVRRALGTLRPDVMVFLETEIWPAWLFESRRKGIRTALINGRISDRSIDGYLKLRPFIKQVLMTIDAFSMILEADARRLIAMGAPADRVEVNGNAKYDLLTSAVDRQLEEKMRRVLNLQPSSRVIVAGSTRRGEEEMILEAYRDILQEYSDTILILAPRHVERASAIYHMIVRRGFSCQLRSRLGEESTGRTAQVMVLDTFGELFGIYSVASIVFLGASLVPLGGQNPLEPAVWGKPVVYGPSMEDFLDAKAILERADAGICISTSDEFSETVRRLFAEEKALTSMGERARLAVMQHRGAAAQQAAVVMRLARLRKTRT